VPSGPECLKVAQPDKQIKTRLSKMFLIWKH